MVENRYFIVNHKVKRKIRIVTEGETEDPNDFEYHEDDMVDEIITIEDEVEQNHRTENKISVTDVARQTSKRFQVNKQSNILTAAKKPEVIELESEGEGEKEKEKETEEGEKEKRPLAQKKPQPKKKATRKAKK